MSAAGVAVQPAGRSAGRLQTLVVVAVTIAAIALVAYVVQPPVDDGVTSVSLTGSVSAAAPAVGSVPPAFSAVTADGKKVSLADYAGKPMWLTFGASWCADCRSEAPDVQATYARHRDQGLVVLAVFIQEPAADIAGYAKRAGLTFPIAVDEKSIVAGSYRTLGIPTHFFIAPDGRIRDMRIGALRPDDMEQAVTALLN